jgi:hypothetical protein
MMSLSLTLFDNVYDNTTHKRMDFSDWDSFERLLYNVAKEPGYKPAKGEKLKKGVKASPLISPSTYKPNTTRANDNVIDWGGWCALDVDDHKFEGDLQNELINKFGRYTFVCYSTSSSTIDLPKFRLVFPTSVRVESNHIRHFWHALNSEISGLGDVQTKDLSRMYYAPGIYPNANNFIFSNRGVSIDPFALMEKHKYVEKSSNSAFDRMPEAIKVAIMKERKSKLTNTDISWTSYHDCPFVSKKAIDDYMVISGSGWYHKMYQIMVSIASSAIRQNYPITPKEIEIICRQIDMETGGWYKNRPLNKEANRALDFVMKNAL